VVLAKRQVFGQVAIDQLPGPTETVLVADVSADPHLTAADMLAQAEHDGMASAILVTTSERLAALVSNRAGTATFHAGARTDRARIIVDHGLIAVVSNVEEAIELANDYAPSILLVAARSVGCRPAGEARRRIFVGKGVQKRWATTRRSQSCHANRRHSPFLLPHPCR